MRHNTSLYWEIWLKFKKTSEWDRYFTNKNKAQSLWTSPSLSAVHTQVLRPLLHTIHTAGGKSLNMPVSIVCIRKIGELWARQNSICYLFLLVVGWYFKKRMNKNILLRPTWTTWITKATYFAYTLLAFTSSSNDINWSSSSTSSKEVSGSVFRGDSLSKSNFFTQSLIQ